jgi:hypothetical protein
MVGRWIYDCGHPGDHGHKTEIHPPKAIASFRRETAQFAGNFGSTPANNAVVFIGRDGGYWRQPINDQDYVFDLYLPPKPHPEAVPKSKIVPRLTGGTNILPVQPQITPYPANEPRALRVVIPLKGVTPHPENYGVVISGGWSDPQGSEAAKVKRIRVTVEEIFMDANLDNGEAEWHVYVGINGRWDQWRSLSGATHKLNYSVELNVAPSDQVHITACGFEADPIHGLMGNSIGGLSWAEVSAKSRARDNADKIKDGFFGLGSDLSGSIENEPLDIFSKVHPPSALQPLTVASPGKGYRLRYRIEVI